MGLLRNCLISSRPMPRLQPVIRTLLGDMVRIVERGKVGQRNGFQAMYTSYTLTPFRFGGGFDFEVPKYKR